MGWGGGVGNSKNLDDTRINSAYFLNISNIEICTSFDTFICKLILSDGAQVSNQKLRKVLHKLGNFIILAMQQINMETLRQEKKKGGWMLFLSAEDQFQYLNH